MCETELGEHSRGDTTVRAVSVLEGRVGWKNPVETAQGGFEAVGFGREAVRALIGRFHV